MTRNTNNKRRIHKRSTALKRSVRNLLEGLKCLMVPTSPLFLMWINTDRCLVCITYPLLIDVSSSITYKSIYIKVIKQTYRGHLLFGGEYQIYFIECGEKPSIYYKCVARVKMQIFTSNEMKYIWYSS